MEASLNPKASIIQPESAVQPVADGMFKRDLLLTDEDMVCISKLIHQRAGIVLAIHKREMIYSRLAKRVRLHGFTRFADYLAALVRFGQAQEWEHFINALTTNLTAFFREPHHFDLLAKHIAGRRGPLRIWCASASTGEEAYSIAITLRETLGDRTDMQILATDIDTDALARASKGIYPLPQVLKHVDRGISRYFLKGRGPRSGLALVRPELSAMLEFSALNLLAPDWPAMGPFDAIFCRNVMIYFDKPTQARLLARFAPLLKPDGLLFAGHSENFSYVSDAFVLRGQTVYALAGKKAG